MADDKRTGNPYDYRGERQSSFNRAFNERNRKSGDYSDASYNAHGQYRPSDSQKGQWGENFGDRYYYDLPNDEEYIYDPKGRQYRDEPKPQRKSESVNNFSVFGSGQQQHTQDRQSQGVPRQPRQAESRQSTRSERRASSTSQSGRAASSNAQRRERPMSNDRTKPTHERRPRPQGAANSGTQRQNAVHNERRHMNKKELDKLEKLKRENKEFQDEIQKGNSKESIIQTKTKETKRKGRLVFLGWIAAIAAVVLVAAVVFCEVRGFPISEVKINGASVYTEEQILSAAEITTGQNMIKIKQGEVEKKLTSALPYIKSVKIKKAYPSVLEMEITETVDKFLFEIGNSFVCVDGDGKIVSSNKKKPKKGQYLVKGLSSYSGELSEEFTPGSDNGDKKRYDILKKIANAVEETGLENCTEINLQNLDMIYIKCSKNCKIYVDSKTDYMTKLRNCADDLKANKVNTNVPCYYDLRYDRQTIRLSGDLDVNG